VKGNDEKYCTSVRIYDEIPHTGEERKQCAQDESTNTLLRDLKELDLVILTNIDLDK
jgi:hypothetical protein